MIDKIFQWLTPFWKPLAAIGPSKVEVVELPPEVDNVTNNLHETALNIALINWAGHRGRPNTVQKTAENTLLL